MGPVQSINLEIPAAHRSLATIDTRVAEFVAQIENLVDAEHLVYGVELAVHEICANIVDHAYTGREDGLIRVRIDLLSEPRRIVVELRDNGRPFDPSSVVEPDLDEPQEHGYGLLIARQLMDELVYKNDTEGNCWQLVKRLT